MTNYDPDQRLNVQVAMNNVLVTSEIIASSCTEGPWKPLLLFVPVRLGINDINPMYFSSLKVFNSVIFFKGHIPLKIKYLTRKMLLGSIFVKKQKLLAWHSH